MSSVPGPIIRFVIDAPGLSAAVQPAMREVREQAHATSQAVAEDWRRMAAQIRASVAQGVMPEKDILAARKQLATELEKEISLLRQRDTLSKSELSSLKAQTLELERQKSFISGGSGLTAATQALIGQIKNIVPQILTGLTGAGGGLGNVAGFASLGAVGGITAVGAAVGVGLGKMAIDGGKLAVELDNMSKKTGMTTEKLIQLRSASQALDIDFDRIVTGFRKFSKETVLALDADLPGATKEAKQAGEIFRILGVDIKRAATDPMSAIQQLSNEFRQLPDGAVKTALAVQLFGRGGLELLPVLAKLPGAMDATKNSSADLARALGPDAAKSAEAFKAQLVNMHNEFDVLEIALSKRILPAFSGFIGWINRVIETLSRPSEAYARVSGGGAGGEFSDFVRDFKAHLGEAGQQSKGAADKLAELAKAIGTTGDGASKAADKFHKLFESGFIRMLEEHPSIRNSPEANRERLNRILDQLINPTAGAAPTIPLGTPSITGPLSNLPHVAIPTGPTTVAEATVLRDKINAEYDKLNKTEEQELRETYDRELKDLNKALERQLLSQREYHDAVAKLSVDLEKQLSERYKHVADSLFEDLISGNTKGFAKTLEKQIEDIILAPIKAQFEKVIAGMLASGRPAAGGTTTASGGGLLGKIFGGIFPTLGPGGTPPFFPGASGLGGIGSGGTATVAIQSGQTGVQTPTVNIQAQNVNLTSGSTSNPLGGSGNFFGTSGPFPPFGTFFGNLNPFGANAGFGGPLGIPGTGGGALGGNLGAIAGGIFLGAIGARSGNVTAEAIGAAATASGIIKAFGGKSPALGKLANALPGVGLFSAGVSEGGAGGAFKDIAGGAEAGLSVAGPVGAAVGAVVGAVTGIFRGIFGGKSFERRVQEALNRQAIFLPPGENFSFASSGSIASTVRTGFGQSGNSFFSFALPAGTPFFANPITGPLTTGQRLEYQQLMLGLNPNLPFLGFPPTNPFVGQNQPGYKPFNQSAPVNVHFVLPGFIDAPSATAALAPHIETITQMVSQNLSSSSSGFGFAARRAVALP